MKKRVSNKIARDIIKITSKDRRYIKRLRKLGASNYEISKDLAIPEDSLEFYP